MRDKVKDYLERWGLIIGMFVGAITIISAVVAVVDKLNNQDALIETTSQKVYVVQSKIKELSDYSPQTKLNVEKLNYLQNKLITLTSKMESNTTRINVISNSYVTLSYFDRDMDIIKNDLTHQINLIIENIKTVNQLKGHANVR